MEHAGKFQAHGEIGHAKDELQHAKESLKNHVKAAGKGHAEAQYRLRLAYEMARESLKIESKP